MLFIVLICAVLAAENDRMMQKENAKMRDEIVEYEKTLKARTDEFRSLMKSEQKIRKDFDAEKLKSAKLEKELNEIQEEYKNWSEHARDVEKHKLEVETMRRERETFELRELIEKLENEMSNLRELNEILTDKLKSNDKSKEIDQLQNDVKIRENTLASKRENIEKLKRENKILKSQKQELDESRHENAKLKGFVRNMATKFEMTALQNELKKREDSLAFYEGNNIKLQKEVEKLRNEKRETTEEIEKLQAQLDFEKEKYKKCELNYDKLQKRLQQKIENQQQQIGSLSTELEKLRRENKFLEAHQLKYVNVKNNFVEIDVGKYV